MVSSNLILFARYPALASALTRVPLVDSPSPVRRLNRFSDALNGDIYIKDDRVTARPYGGNKPRKLEFLLADAQARGARSIVTTGGIGSNHCLATTIYSRCIDAKSHLILFPQPVTPHVRMSLRLYMKHGASVHLGADYSCLESLRNQLMKDLEHPYFIPAGGSNAIGAIGFVNAALELVAQIDEGEAPEPAAVFIAAGTCGSLAGLLLGFELAGRPIPVFGVQVVDPVVTNPDTVRRLMRETRMLLHEADASIAPESAENDSIRLLTTFFGDGYGHPTRPAEAARRLMRTCEGIDLESTYTAKTLAALVQYVRTGFGSGPVLFWNTFAGPVLEGEASVDAEAMLPENIRELLKRS